MDRVVSSMSETTPRRMPVVRAWPTPSTLMVGCFGRSPSSSAMMAVVFADPISSPATRRSGFIRASWQSGDHLITVTKIELGRVQLLATEIGFDGFDFGETFQTYILHRTHGLRRQL